MVIDIDSFLDKFAEETIENKEQNDLEFQKDVEDKLLRIQKEAENKDIVIIREIYEIIKRFDQDLSSKFLGLENKSGIAIENLGKKYSDNYLNLNIKSADVITKRIRDKLSKIENELSRDNYEEIFILLKEIKNEITLHPKTLIKEKSSLISFIKKKEIEIYQRLEEYKKKELHKIKSTLNILVNNLKISLSKNETRLIENSLDELKVYISNIPKVLLPSLIDEKIKLNKIIMVSQNYLIRCYDKDYHYRKNVINLLIKKFHANTINKNVKACVLIYNEVLVEFEKIPDVFLKDKIDIYSKIIKLFTQLNSLMMKENVEMFLQSYNESRRIEAKREYLKHVQEAKLHDIKKPSLEDKNLKNTENSAEKINFQKNNLSSSGQVSSFEEKIKIESEISNEVNINMLKEIEMYFNKLKVSTNEAEVKKLYEKIVFYLRIVNIDEKKKIEILTKIKKTAKRKGYLI